MARPLAPLTLTEEERNAASVGAKTENRASPCLQGKDRACLCSRPIQR